MGDDSTGKGSSVSRGKEGGHKMQRETTGKTLQVNCTPDKEIHEHWHQSFTKG